MAKDQNLSLNHEKLSGVCGRLRCCLQYEQDLYRDLRRTLPKLGKSVQTPSGEGRVKDVDVLRGRVRVQLAGGEYADFASADVQAPAPDIGARPPPHAGQRPGRRAVPTANNAAATLDKRSSTSTDDNGGSSAAASDDTAPQPKKRRRRRKKRPT